MPLDGLHSTHSKEWSSRRWLEGRGNSRHTMLAMAGDEGLEPSYLDLEASVLAAGPISGKFVAELTAVEPVPADRQSALP